MLLMSPAQSFKNLKDGRRLLRLLPTSAGRPRYLQSSSNFVPGDRQNREAEAESMP